MSHAVQPFKRTTTTNKNVDDDDARPYVIVEDIGKGSFATVYKGYHEVHPFGPHDSVPLN
jgi:serine/threonine-protein kinase ULK2